MNNFLHSLFDFNLSERSWKVDPRILYGSQSDTPTENPLFQKLLATAIPEEGSVDSFRSEEYQLPDDWTDWTSAETSDAEIEKMVQLATVSLAPPCVGSIKWALGHWREAETIALTFRGWGKQAVMPLYGVREAARLAEVQRRAAAWQHVRHFALHLELGGCSYKSSGLQEIVGARCTPRLESLCLVCDTPMFFGPKPTLKHLRVEVKDQALLYMIQSVVRNNAQLETLTICSDIQMDQQRCCALDLAGMKRLRCVNLQMVMPEGLKVPPGCQVHFVCHDVLAASKVWDEGLGVACTSCHLVELVEYEHAEGLPSVHDCLQRIVDFSCPNLTVLKLHRSVVGSKKAPLIIGKCLPALRELEVQAAENLHMYVGAGLSLESLAIFSDGVLNFEMEDLDLLLSSLKRFRFACGRCFMVTHMLLWRLSDIREWITTANVDGPTEIRRRRSTRYDGVALETGGCRDHTCGTCVHCLRRKHLPVSDNVEWPFVGIFANSEQ